MSSRKEIFKLIEAMLFIMQFICALFAGRNDDNPE